MNVIKFSIIMGIMIGLLAACDGDFILRMECDFRQNPIRGQVLDFNTGEPIPDTKVEIQNLAVTHCDPSLIDTEVITLSTDAEGFFSVSASAIIGDAFDVTITAPGCRDLTYDYYPFTDGSNQDVFLLFCD